MPGAGSGVAPCRSVMVSLITDKLGRQTLQDVAAVVAAAADQQPLLPEVVKPTSCMSRFMQGLSNED